MVSVSSGLRGLHDPEENVGVKCSQYRYVRWALLAVVTVGAVAPGSALGAAPPTPQQAVAPSRNANEFSAPPLDAAALQKAQATSHDPDARVQAGPVPKRGGPAPRVPATRAPNSDRMRSAPRLHGVPRTGEHVEGEERDLRGGLLVLLHQPAA